MNECRVSDSAPDDLYEIAVPCGRQPRPAWVDGTGRRHRTHPGPTHLQTTPAGEFSIHTGSCARPARLRLRVIAAARDVDAGNDSPMAP